MGYVIREVENDKAILKIIQDSEPMNPREEFDNFGHMICWHNRYNLGDDHNYSDIEELKEEILADLGYSYNDIDKMSSKELDDVFSESIVILPLFLYDHSGITMNTTGFSCNWDSGQVGVIYVTHDEIVGEFGDFDMYKAKTLLEGEVKTYDKYLTGDVYGFTLEEKQVCDDCGNIELEVVESCWGFYGINNIIDDLDGYISNDYFDLVQQIKGA